MRELGIKDVDGNEVMIDCEAIDQFAARIKGEVLLPDDPGYEDARKVWNAMIDRRPALIVRCADAEDAVACVQLASRHSLLTSVRGGGHNVAGNAMNDGGLLIDLSLMHEVTVDEERRIAHVQGGATLGDVDKATQRFGLATPLGVVPPTGVAGLALHGGLGWLLRRFGTTADNIVAAEVVTADGTLRHASEKENSDLLWALRGGGGNLGVVPSFDLQLHRVGPTVWAGLIIYALDDLPDALPAFTRYMDNAPDELTANIQLWSAPPLPSLPPELVGRTSFAVTACYSGPVEKGNGVLSPLKKLGTPLADLSTTIEFLEMQGIATSDGTNAGGTRHYWKSIYLEELTSEAVEVLRNAAKSRPSELSTMTIYFLGGAYARFGSDHAAFDNRDQRFLVTLEADWNDPREDNENIRWAREAFDALRKNSQARVYLNFPGFAEEERMAEHSYADNLARLSEIKAKYDPQDLFRGNLSVRPAMRKLSAHSTVKVP